MADTTASHAFTRDEWHRIGALIVDEGARMELVEGDSCEMTPIGDRHALCVKRRKAAEPPVVPRHR